MKGTCTREFGVLSEAFGVLCCIPQVDSELVLQKPEGKDALPLF